MAKFKVTLEFNVPDNVPDLCWRGPEAGPQVLHDVILTPALCQLTKRYAEAVQSKDKGLISYADMKLEILNTVKVT
jgi:hypothetical protein